MTASAIGQDIWQQWWKLLSKPPWTLHTWLVRETIVDAGDVAHRSAQMEEDGLVHAAQEVGL